MSEFHESFLTKSVTALSLKNIYESDELRREATVAKFATVRVEEGRRIFRDLEYYNLDAIISVGYSINRI